MIRRKGYERTTMEEVARRAGMTTGAIYRELQESRGAVHRARAEVLGADRSEGRAGATFAEAMRALATATLAAVDDRAPVAVGRLTDSPTR
jgi:AcrR family transcriptional regulator